MRVLLVEDDYAISQSIETMLKKEGMIVDTTDLGEDGLEIGKLYDYDIIILDLMLPDMNGYEVMELLHSSDIGNSRDIPIIVSTAMDKSSETELLAAGFNGCLFKPFSSEEAALAITSCISNAQQPQIDFSTCWLMAIKQRFWKG